MAKTVPIEEQLKRLTSLRQDIESGSARDELTRFLSNNSNLVVAKAASILTGAGRAEFLPQLAEAFDRFISPGSDKGCVAKTALARALYELGHRDEALFLRGIHHRQCEPAYGGSVDTAAEHRGISALGLVRMGYPDVLLELAVLLADPEPQTRLTAVRAVGYTESELGIPLLRLKALAGDRELDITAECLHALMKLSPGKSLIFVAEFLESLDDALAESAAHAVGSDRSSKAAEMLIETWAAQLRTERRRPLLFGLAMTRQPKAIDFLLERIADDRPEPAADAVAALTMYKHDRAIRQRVSDAVKKVDDRSVTAAFIDAFKM